MAKKKIQLKLQYLVKTNSWSTSRIFIWTLLLFNIYIKHLFYLSELTDVCNYADDTTFHASDSDLGDLIRRLEHNSALAIELFESSSMKFLLSGHKHEVMFAKVGHSKLWESCALKVLGIIIDWKLKFDEYILTQCKKAGRKLKAL